MSSFSLIAFTSPSSTMRPFSITYTYWAKRSAMFAFCSASSTATFSSRLSRPTISKISCTSMGASPIEGSSSSISRGWAMRARPIASICCSPPET